MTLENENRETWSNDKLSERIEGNKRDVVLQHVTSKSTINEEDIEITNKKLLKKYKYRIKIVKDLNDVIINQNKELRNTIKKEKLKNDFKDKIIEKQSVQIQERDELDEINKRTINAVRTELRYSHNTTGFLFSILFFAFLLCLSIKKIHMII